MRRFWQWFCGYVKIKLSGRQINRFLNLCSKKGIWLWNISGQIEHSIMVHVRLSDFYALKPYLKKTKTKLRILAKKGFPFWCFRHPRLKWLCIVLVLCLAMLGYSRSYIWKIQIHGNNEISDYDILMYLNEQNIDIGLKKDRIDCSLLEYGLRQEFQQLSWVSVYIDHTDLCLEIRESLYDPFPEENPEIHHQYDLIANKDAQIYSIVTRSGEAVVQKGSIVKAGERLVLGRYMIYDDAGEVKDIKTVPADALIYGDVTYPFRYCMTEMEILALKQTGVYSKQMLYFLAEHKMAQFLKKLEENGVIILDKNVIIEKEKENIIFSGEIKAREKIGVILPVEEMLDYEPE